MTHWNDHIHGIATATDTPIRDLVNDVNEYLEYAAGAISSGEFEGEGHSDEQEEASKALVAALNEAATVLEKALAAVDEEI